MNKEKKVLIIGKPISKMNESEVDEVLNELVKNGTLKKDQNGNVYKPNPILEGRELSIRCKICNREVFESDIRMGKNDVNDQGICKTCEFENELDQYENIK